MCLFFCAKIFAPEKGAPGWVVVSKIFYFHPYLGKIPILAIILQRGWFNHQLAGWNFCHLPRGLKNRVGIHVEKSMLSYS